MGYRSDVGLCLSGNGKKTLDAKLAELEPEANRTRYIHNLLDCPRSKREEDGAIAYLWEDMKWYIDYDDVSFIENLMKDLDDDDYYFIRIGESDDDIEIRGGFWENPFSMCVVRGISFD